MQSIRAARLWLHKYASRLLQVGIVLVWALLLAHKVIPDYIPHVLELSLGEAIIVSMFLFTVERLVELEEKIEHVAGAATAGVLVGVDRNRGNRQFVLQLGAFPEQCLDLLQFSGFAVVDTMREVAELHHGATFRLLITSQANAARFDGADFHEDNVRGTYQKLRVLHSVMFRPSWWWHLAQEPVRW